MAVDEIRINGKAEYWREPERLKGYSSDYHRNTSLWNIVTKSIKRYILMLFVFYNVFCLNLLLYIGVIKAHHKSKGRIGKY
jgi:hypothetical protein